MAFAKDRGAFLWPEALAVLSETDWIRSHVFAGFPEAWFVDPIHLGAARTSLVKQGMLRQETTLLGGRFVTAYLWTEDLTRYGRRTDIRSLASTKRRLYRRYLQWTGRTALCGGHAEALVETALRSLTGRALWLPSTFRRGNVREVMGRPIAGGPLDAAGFWATDRDDPTKPFVPFVVEVKNLRDSLYPWDNEVWDLLAKASAFPDVVPVLVARRLHQMTFNMFKDLGALGTLLGNQVFSTAIDAEDFRRVTTGLSLHNAERSDAESVMPRLAAFFGRTGPEQASGFLERWKVAAGTVAQFTDLRRTDLPQKERRRLWRRFGAAILGTGLYERKGWASVDRSGGDHWFEFEDEQQEEVDEDEFEDDTP